jgi:tRNA pseudouridine38-40 synthase
MPRYKITVAYDGTLFNGWQRQRASGEDVHSVEAASDEPPADVGLDAGRDRRGRRGSEMNEIAEPSPRIRTVQDVLQRAVREVVREPVEVLGASRTDSGVHARGQVAAFTTSANIPVDKLPRAITSRLPDDVQVTHAEIVHDGFDPIRGAIAKSYRYRIAHDCARGPLPVFARHFVMRYPHKLDAACMNEAASCLLGEHDFTSFARISHGRESAVRTIYNCTVTATARRRLRIDVVGSGFLYNMVRIIAGTLVEIGRSAERDPLEIVKILKSKDRRAAGPTLPPTGLCLMWIKYPELSCASCTSPRA